MDKPSANTHRSMCYKCHKPEPSCLCSIITSIENKTNILILQHPNERFHPLGTARIAKLALRNSQLEVAWNGFCNKNNMAEFIKPRAAILYPSDDARDLETLAASELPEQLVVLDGTWHTAKQIYRDNPVLHGLPKFSLSPVQPSLYRIRKAPKPEQRSTIEAIWQALRHLEPDNDAIDQLLVPFERMIDRQITFKNKPRPRTRDSKTERVTRKPLSSSLTHDFNSLIIGYGEFIPAPSRHLGYQLLAWAAHKPSTGETFMQALRPDGPNWLEPSDRHLAHMELTRETLSQGMSLLELQKAWAKFAGPNYTLGTWNEITHRLFSSMMKDGAKPVQLKHVYCSIKGDKCGPLHTVAERHNSPIPKLGLNCRAGLRLSNAVAITRYLRERGLEQLENTDA